MFCCFKKQSKSNALHYLSTF